MPKVLCPRHEDKEPSCEIYAENAYCFAGCGSIPLSELGVKKHARTKDKEDIQAKISYIRSLPENVFRGFLLPYDSIGYYICWPEDKYYKLRLFDKDAKCRYLGPSGYKPPILQVSNKPTKTCFLVEGEFNAFSVFKAFPEHTVMSLGAASEFNLKRLSSELTHFRQYDTIVLIVDKDAAGTLAAINSKVFFIKLNKIVRVVFTELNRDCNDIYIADGREKLREEIEEKLSKGL